MQNDARRKKGQQIAVVIAGTGLCWIALQILGSALGLSQKVMVLFDMLAGVGFVMALWLSYQLRKRAQPDPAQPDGANRSAAQRDSGHTDRN